MFLDVTYSAAYFLPAAIKPKSVYLKKSANEIQIVYTAKTLWLLDKNGMTIKFTDILRIKFNVLKK